MRLIYRPIDVWPGKRTEHPKPSPFEATWTATLNLLDKEIFHLGAGEVVLQVDSPNERDFRLDGQMRADAKLRSGAVILNIETKRHGKLSYPCDTFYAAGYRNKLQSWQVNVRAIALGLEALRKMERYGIANTGQQYTGWRAIGTGIPLPAPTEMTFEEAADFMRMAACWPADKGLVVEEAFRQAAAVLHPDRESGDAEMFKKLTVARAVLLRD